MEEKLEIRLANLIRMFGSKNSKGGYRLGLSNMELKINGNFCEEFEDLDKAPCIVNYVAVDSDDVTPWFNMQALFGWTGLVWGDKYSVGAMGQANIKKIIDYVESVYGKTIKDKKRLAELRRAEWLKVAKDNERNFLVGIYSDDEDKKKDDKGVDFHHAVDCVYCCYSRQKSDDLGLTLDELKNNILKSIDKTTAFFLRVQYPTRKSLASSYYLAGQSGERYARWSHIIPLVNKKIHRMIKPHEIKELLALDPKDVLVKGRLKGDEQKNVRKIVKPKKAKDGIKKKEEPRSWPLLYSAEAYGLKLSTDQWVKWREEKRKEYAAKVKKLGHPRFEIVLGEKYRRYYQLQVMGIVWMYAFNPDDKQKAKYPEHARFYNGTKETSIPTLETVVIDHFDKDKTPYLLGDIARICDKGYKEDPAEGFFCRIDTPLGERIVTYDFIRESDIDDRDWHGDRYSREARWIHSHISKPARKNRKLDVSQRTGMSYANLGYHARITGDSVKKLWNVFDKTFEVDEQKILDVDLLDFDHEAFSRKLREASSPLLSEDFKVVPKQYMRGYEDHIKSTTGYSKTYDVPRDRMLQAQRSWWSGLYRIVLQNAIRVGRKDTLDYKLLNENRDLIPCEFTKVGYYYLTPDKDLKKDEMQTAKEVRMVVNAILNRKNVPAVPAL